MRDLTATLASACLPPSLQASEPRIASISDGLSGAGVYRVDAGGRAFVLKVAQEQVAPARWHRTLTIWRDAARAGLTPALVHVDEERRAVLTELVVDRAVARLYRDPLTHERIIADLGGALRRVHALPFPAAADDDDPVAAPWALLGTTWRALTTAGIAVPRFVERAAEELLTESPPRPGDALVLSHNDVHPKNLVHDGVGLYLMDWDAAGPNEPFYDLATIALFLAMDGVSCRKLLSAYETAGQVSTDSLSAESPLPARFLYDRRLIAALCGAGFLQFGFHSGYTAGANAARAQTLESAPTLGEVYKQIRAGSLSLATGEGRWAFGLALARESAVPLM